MLEILVTLLLNQHFLPGLPSILLRAYILHLLSSYLHIGDSVFKGEIYLLLFLLR